LAYHELSLLEANQYDIYRMELGRYIRFKRIGLGHKVRPFAVIADIEHHQLINIEKGRVDMRFSTLIKIAEAFQLLPEELLEEARNHEFED